jgi:hypothetical protein
MEKKSMKRLAMIVTRGGVSDCGVWRTGRYHWERRGGNEGSMTDDDDEGGVVEMNPTIVVE